MKGLQVVRSIRSPIARGVVLGAITGLILSAIYGAAVIGFLVVLMTLYAPGTPPGDYFIQLAMVSVTSIELLSITR